MDANTLIVFSGHYRWLAIAGLQRKGPLRLLVEWLTALRAVCYAIQDFIVSGSERWRSRWAEYLERARKEV